MKYLFLVAGLVATNGFAENYFYTTIEDAAKTRPRERVVANLEMAAILVGVLVEHERDVYGRVQTTSFCYENSGLCKNLDKNLDKKSKK